MTDDVARERAADRLAALREADERLVQALESTTAGAARIPGPPSIRSHWRFQQPDRGSPPAAADGADASRCRGEPKRERACNMLADAKIDTMVAHLLGKPGWDGMFHAAAVSGGGDCS
jgi:hypothetical protein